MIKPTFSSTITQPTTVTSNNETATFVLTNFNSTKQDVRLKTGSHGTLAMVGNTAVVSGLANGQKAEIVVSLKSGQTWTDGTTGAIELTSAIVNHPPILV